MTRCEEPIVIGVYDPKNLGNDKTCSQASSKRFSVYNPKILGNVKFTIHGIVLFEGVYNPKILSNDKENLTHFIFK